LARLAMASFTALDIEYHTVSQWWNALHKSVLRI
jgi:hypothetical protein